MSTWIGVCQKNEMAEDTWNSCLSYDVREELTHRIRDQGLVAAPGVTKSSPWMSMPEDMGNVITKFLTRHPLLTIMFKQGIEHAKEILCAWYATEDIYYTKAPAKDDYTKTSWNEYFASIDVTHVRALETATEWYNMHFYADEKTQCYYVIGPRDTMTALFGWHAKISDAQLNIDLKSKVALSYEDFIRVHIAVDYAERCHGLHFHPM